MIRPRQTAREYRIATPWLVGSGTIPAQPLWLRLEVLQFFLGGRDDDLVNGRDERTPVGIGHYRYDLRIRKQVLHHPVSILGPFKPEPREPQGTCLGRAITNPRVPYSCPSTARSESCSMSSMGPSLDVHRPLGN